MITRLCILSTTLALALTAAACGAERRSSAGKPNVLLIVVDTLRKDHLGCYGYGLNTSPNIDRLADDAVRYENAISQAPWTTPSIAALLTSQFPATLGIEDHLSPLDSSWTLLPEALQAAGYTTFGVVTHTFCSSKYNFDQGFDSFDEERVLGHNAATSAGNTEKALAFIESHPGEPLFLWLHYFDPHRKFIRHEGLDPNSELGLNHPVRSYDSEIAYTDRQIGVLLDRLRELDLYEDALIVFVADHGEELGDHGRFGHSRTLFQELVNVPLLIKFPHGQGRVIETPVASVDVYPTILDGLGIAVPDGLAGISLYPPGTEERRPLFTETAKGGARLRAVVLGHHKLIRNLKNGEETLFDLASDPAEMSPLDAREHPLAVELRQALDAWVRELELHPANDVQIDLTPAEVEQLRMLGYAE